MASYNQVSEKKFHSKSLDEEKRKAVNFLAQKMVVV